MNLKQNLQPQTRMDPRTYVTQFNIVERFDMSQTLFAALLNCFKIRIDQDKYLLFRAYQESVFDLVEDLREMEVEFIQRVLEYILTINNYLPDIIIMLWCLPRTDIYLSRKKYDAEYLDLIQKYHSKMVQLIEHDIVQDFCIESLSKVNNVPVHCIDYIWHYTRNLSFEFVFYNDGSAHYVGITPGDASIKLGFNMEYVLRLGLGKGSFSKVITKFVTDPALVKIMLETRSENYRRQLGKIIQHKARYFGNGIEQIPPEVEDLVNKM